MTTIVCISDIHTRHRNVVIPECDILLSAGDYSFSGNPLEISEFHKWLNDQPTKEIVSVQGNHELWVEKNFDLAKKAAQIACPRVRFIEEGPLLIDGIRIWCASVTPFFYNWAYNRQRGLEINRHWDMIPDDTQVLVTHGPPAGILDQTVRGENVGCEDLRARIQKLPQLKLHVFGHIHHAYGVLRGGGTTFVNASICNEKYEPANEPVRFEL